MTTEIKVPEMGESVVEATVARWLKQVGDRVNAGEAVVELETDKVNIEVAADAPGVLARIDQPAGADVKIGALLAVLEPATSKAPTVIAATPPIALASPPSSGEEQRATPVAKRIAAEEGVDLAAITPTTPSARVTKQDVENYLRQQAPEVGDPLSVVSGQPPVASPQFPLPTLQSPSVNETRVRMSRRRRTIADRLVQAQHNTAMLTTFNELDMSAVLELRKRRNEQFEKRHGVKLGFMSVFVKAVIGALKAVPPLNSEIQEDDILLKHYYDIGIAVGAEEGLVVPVLRQAERLSFAEIEKAIKSLANKARDGTLSIEELRGGTFTITNGGIFGSLLSTPILNPPQVGILGMHKIEERPIALNGQVVIRPMMYVALSYDHRIVDGRQAVQFLVKVKELVEEPEMLLLEG
jgi:2-oxoglutarate dehydrogenase E2 component (dihydrolipoamide succinyltransferase)